MFENYKFDGLYIAIQAVLTLYAQGICLTRNSQNLSEYKISVNVLMSVSVNVEFKVTLHEQVRYRCTLQY